MPGADQAEVPLIGKLSPEGLDKRLVLGRVQVIAPRLADGQRNGGGAVGMSAIVKGYRTRGTTADADRARGTDGSRPGRPIRLEGGNRGSVALTRRLPYGDLSVTRDGKTAI